MRGAPRSALLFAAALLWGLVLMAAAHAGEMTFEGSPPDAVTLDSLGNVYGPVEFSHSMHTFIAGECQVCHHQHGNQERYACAGCHKIDPDNFRRVRVESFLACRMCHDAGQSPETPGMPGLKVAYHRKCFACHDGMGGIGTTPEGCTKTCHDKREQDQDGSMREKP